MKTTSQLLLAILVTCFVANGQEVPQQQIPHPTEASGAANEDPGAEREDTPEPETVGTLLNEAGRLSGANDWSHAIDAYLRATELDPNSFLAHYSLGLAYLQTGQYRAAIPPLQQATRLKGKSSRSWNLLGLAHYRLKEFERAVPYFRRASEADPKRPAPFNNLGHSLLRLGRYSAAQQAFNSALQIDPDFGNAVTGLCIALFNIEPLSQRGANTCR
jgi:Flp pilus assembly protein TadD